MKSSYKPGYTDLIVMLDVYSLEVQCFYGWCTGSQTKALAGVIVLCSRERHFTLTVPLSTKVYKWVPANLMLGLTLRWTSIPSRESKNTPSCFMLNAGFMATWFQHRLDL